jgi:Icc-related predicted phosphoesterase
VREVIKKYQPVVGLHRHIRETKGAQGIARTTCFNPGCQYSSDVLRGVIVDFDTAGDYLDFLFTSG